MQNKTLARAIIGLSGLVLGGVAWGQLCVLPDNTAFHDDVNNLTWLRNPPTTRVNWATAGTNAASASGLGGTGRLPTRAEYSSLYSQLAGNGSVVGTYSTRFLYWTSETAPGGGGNQRYTVNLATGSINTNNRNNQLLYWPVRTDSTSVCPATTGCSASGYGYTTQLTNVATPPNIQNALSGKRIMAKAPAPTFEEWNEDHCAGGDLYKVGAGTAVDPRVKRGTWTTSGAGVSSVVRYSYTGIASPYDWSLWTDASGGLCWQGSTGNVIATDPAPIGSAGTPCN